MPFQRRKNAVAVLSDTVSSCYCVQHMLFFLFLFLWEGLQIGFPRSRPRKITTPRHETYFAKMRANPEVRGKSGADGSCQADPYHPVFVTADRQGHSSSHQLQCTQPQHAEWREASKWRDEQEEEAQCQHIPQQQ